MKFRCHLFFLNNSNILILYFRKISREEFVGQEAKPKVMGTDAKAELAFNVFDKNHDGYITKNEMLKASKNLTKEQVNKWKWVPYLRKNHQRGPHFCLCTR